MYGVSKGQCGILSLVFYRLLNRLKETENVRDPRIASCNERKFSLQKAVSGKVWSHLSGTAETTTLNRNHGLLFAVAFQQRFGDQPLIIDGFPSLELDGNLCSELAGVFHNTWP